MTASASLGDKVMDYLASHRTASLGNIAAHCGCDVEALGPVVDHLESQQRLRCAISRCQSGCEQCDGCESESVSRVLSERTIVISLERIGDAS